MARTIAPGDVFEAVTDSDPRGEYRIEVRSGSVRVGKSRGEVSRGRGDTLDKYNRARVTVGERSESVFVHNPGNTPAVVDFTKSGFGLDFLSSSTQETASERDERNRRTIQFNPGYLTLSPGQTDVRHSQAITSDWLGEFGDAAGVLLTGVDVAPDNEIAPAQREQLSVQVYVRDAEMVTPDWSASTTAEDAHLSFGDGERAFAPVDDSDPWEIEAIIDNYGAYSGGFHLIASFRVID